MADDLGTADKSLENIQKKIKDIVKETAKIRFTEAFSGDPKKIMEISFDRAEAQKEANKEHLRSIKLAKEEIKEQEKLNKGYVEQAGIFSKLGMRSLVGNFALKNMEGLKTIASLKTKIRVSEEKIQNATAQINQYYDTQIENELAKLNTLEKRNKLTLDEIKYTEALKAAKMSGTDTALADLILSESKLKVLDAQRKIIEENSKANLKGDEEKGIKGLEQLQREMTERKAKLIDAPAEVERLKAEIKATKMPDVLGIEESLSVLTKRLKSLRHDKSLAVLGTSTGTEGGLSSEDSQYFTTEEARLLKEITELKTSVSEDSLAKKKEEYRLTLDALNAQLQTAKSNADSLRLIGESEEGIAKRISEEKIKTALALKKLDAQRIALEKKANKDRLIAAKGFVNIVTSGLELGAMEFSEDLLTGAEMFAKAIEDSLDGVAETFGSAFREYLETGEGVGDFFYNALTDVFLNIAEEFATNVARDLINQLITSQASKAIGGLVSSGAGAVAGEGGQGLLSKAMGSLATALGLSTAAETAGTAAKTAGTAVETTGIAATTANTAAETAGATATTANASASAVNTAGTAVNTGGLLTNSLTMMSLTMATILNTASMFVVAASLIIAAGISAAGSIFGSGLVVVAIALQTVVLGALLGTIVGMLLIANVLLAVIAATSLFGNAGGLVPKAFKKGGNVQGLAGGGVPLSNPKGRKRAIPASDTVPAMLTPGEFVLTVGMVKQVGVRALEAWRTGGVPPSFAPARAHVSHSTSRLQSFATGGVVGSVRGRESSSERPVNVAFFDDRKAMSRWAETTEGETAILRVMQNNAHRFA